VRPTLISLALAMRAVFFSSDCCPRFWTLTRVCTPLTKSEEQERLPAVYQENLDEAPTTRYAVYPACDGAHLLAKCKIFIDKGFEERLQVMRKAQLCHNCFKYDPIAVGYGADVNIAIVIRT